MTLGDIDSQFRVYTAEPDNTGRWSQADAAALFNEARNYIALLLRWPDATWVNVLSGGQQEFTIPEILEIDRVYLAGQPIYPTSIPILEGTDIEYYDQSALNNTPQWNTQPYAGYPVSNSQFGYPIGVSPSFYPGQRPGYYMRGGNIGFVPPPASAYTVQIDGVGVPPQLVNQSDVDIFPSFFKHAIAWKAAEIGYAADKAIESATAASSEYMKWEKQLISWKRQLQRNKPRGPRFISYRHFWSRGSLVGR